MAVSEEFVQYKGLHGLGTTHTYIDHGTMARVTNRTHKILPWHIIVDVLKRNPDVLLEHPGCRVNLVIKTVVDKEFLMVARSFANDRVASARSCSVYSQWSISSASPPMIRSASGFSETSIFSSISEAWSPSPSRSSTPGLEEKSPQLQRYASGGVPTLQRYPSGSPPMVLRMNSAGGPPTPQRMNSAGPSSLNRLNPSGSPCLQRFNSGPPATLQRLSAGIRTMHLDSPVSATGEEKEGTRFSIRDAWKKRTTSENVIPTRVGVWG